MDYQALLDDITTGIGAQPDRGNVANYIPELARVDPNNFAMALCTADGRTFQSGNAQTRFSIQSVSKVFTLAIALGRVGHQLWERVGREPSGQAFNSIVQLERENGIPRNPFINAGAIITTDTILAGRTPKECLTEILDFVRMAADDTNIYIDEAVARSETKTGYRNFALAHFMRAHGNLQNEPEMTLGTYFHQCAIEMTAVQLARTGRFLMNSPDVPRLVSADRIRRINAMMLTCGHYDASGEFAYKVGLPGKSGVGGGILMIAPKKASVAVWSPGLNAWGNSHLGALAMEEFATRTGWSIFS